MREVSESPYWMFWNVDDNIWGAGLERSIKALYRTLPRAFRFEEVVDRLGDLVSVQGKKATNS